MTRLTVRCYIHVFLNSHRTGSSERLRVVNSLPVNVCADNVPGHRLDVRCMRPPVLLRISALFVDATETPRKIFHARMTIPAQPGTLTLYYPKMDSG